MSLSQTELKRIKKSGIIAAVIFLTIATLHLFKGHHRLSIAFYLLAGAFFIMTGFFPAVFKKITDALGELITGLMLSIVFYLVITPMGLIMRLFRKDPLDKKIERGKDSYWIEKEPATEDITRYEKQF